jgi:hypothetical protein
MLRIKCKDIEIEKRTIRPKGTRTWRLGENS